VPSVLKIRGESFSVMRMIQWINRWGLPVFAAIILVAGITVQFIAKLQPVSEGTLKAPLSESIPAQLAGWQVTELDLGPTESVTQRSYDLLKLDDFVHRNYARGDKAFSVYVAYWKPGKMPVRLVNQHSPDRCWTEVGWSCSNRDWNVVKTVDGVALQPAQWGVYELNDYTNHTYFWHIVGGEVHWYGGKRINTRSSITSIWQDFTKYGLNVHREQFFIRVVSVHSMDGLWEDRGFKEVMLDLAELCLAQPGTGDKLSVK
jgi:hypothetical protein